MNIVGRKEEIKKIQQLSSLNEAVFLAFYGRRRVGKTYLIEQYYGSTADIFFQVVGLKEGDLHQQLAIFRQALIDCFYPGTPLKEFTNWLEAFESLTQAINAVGVGKSIVLFFDELPWLATVRSGLVQTIDHYWNVHWSKIKTLTLITCGSAASWMLDHLIHAKGGLHNRITASFLIKPFTFWETKDYLKSIGFNKKTIDIFNIYLVLGGIPYYLKMLKNQYSVLENINRLCFSPEGLLFSEFDNLFKSLFNNYKKHEEFIRAIAKSHGGISREMLLSKKKFSSGGKASSRLQELEAAGFITSFIPYGNKGRGLWYKAIDLYSLFYLRWIEPNKAKLKLAAGDLHFWENIFGTPKYYNWFGYAFENFCFQHLSLIMRALNIESVVIGISDWRFIPKTEESSSGAQIDLLFDRSDNCINVCEIKTSQEEFVITKEYALVLENKMKVFKEKTGIKKELLLTFITLNGLKWNEYAKSMVSFDIAIKDIIENI